MISDKSRVLVLKGEPDSLYARLGRNLCFGATRKGEGRGKGLKSAVPANTTFISPANKLNEKMPCPVDGVEVLAQLLRIPDTVSSVLTDVFCIFIPSYIKQHSYSAF